MQLDFSSVCCSLEHVLDLVVEDESKSTTCTSEDVAKASLEESSTSLIGVDLLEAIESSVIHGFDSSLSGVHHESSSHGIERVSDDTSSDGDDLCESPHGEEVSFLNIYEQHNFTSIEQTELRGGSVSDDTNNGDTKTVVEATNSVFGRFLR